MRRRVTWRRGPRKAFAVQCRARVPFRCVRRSETRSRRVARGQSTVEYALVVVAFLALVIALGALWRLFEGGTVTLHALQSASHHLQDVATGAWGDVFLY